MNEEKYLIKSAIIDFFTSYFEERNVAQTIDKCEENMLSIGTGLHEIACNIDEFEKLCDMEISQSSKPLYFEIKNYKEQILMPSKMAFAIFDMAVSDKFSLKESEILINVRVSTTFRKNENIFKALNFHVSTATIEQEEGEFFPVQIPSKHVETLKEKALTDALTSSYNRHYIETKISNLLAKPSLNTIILIDLDNFKCINDNLGHPIGDEVLIGFSSICKNSIRENDTFARIGGDEFFIILNDINREFASSVYERIKKQLKKDFGEYMIKYGFNFSMGVTEILPTDTSFAEIFSRIDTILYKIKHKGGGFLSF